MAGLSEILGQKGNQWRHVQLSRATTTIADNTVWGKHNNHTHVHFDRMIGFPLPGVLPLLLKAPVQLERHFNHLEVNNPFYANTQGQMDAFEVLNGVK